VVNFKNTVIIFTSNLGSGYLNDLPPDTPVTSATKELVQGAIRGHFAPEFINRLDSIIIFNPLGRKVVTSIVDVRLAEIQKRLTNNGKKITIHVSEPAKSWLADNGYHPSYGARPLNRVIQNELLNPLSRYIIEERIKDGEVAEVEVDLKANRLLIKPNHPSSVKYDEEDEMDLDDEIDADNVRIVGDSPLGDSN
jgi:ATP-dependent Clp protease ATP-binding subunit ClpA